ncbi:MAG: glycosyltransferase family 4 protein [Acidimicrobiia bacterium]
MIGQRGLPASHGGIERHVEELSIRLARRNHEVVVFCRRNYVEGRRTDYQGVRLAYPPTYSSKHLEAALHSGVSSLQTLGRHFDVVHYHAVGPGLWSPIPRWLTGAKVVQTIHGLDQDRAKWGRFARAVLRAGFWMSKHAPDAVIVVGAYLLDSYRDRRRITRHIPNGVAPESASDSGALENLGLTAGEYALFVGRLIPEKGIDHLLRAFSAVATQHRLVVVGGSSFTDDYELALRELASADPRVVMPGYLYGSDLAALYAGAAVYVQPSFLEGSPLTVLEALAHGLPVVLSDIAAHRELVPARRLGSWVYPAGDVRALTEALSEALAAGPDAWQEARLDQARVIDRHDWEAVAEQTERLYIELCDRPQKVSMSA